MLGFKRKPDDPLYNRRRFMVLMALFAVIWGVVILVCTILFRLTEAMVLSFLSYTGTLAGAGIFDYFKSCKVENSCTTSSVSSSSTALQSSSSSDSSQPQGSLGKSTEPDSLTSDTNRP